MGLCAPPKEHLPTKKFRISESISRINDSLCAKAAFLEQKGQRLKCQELNQNLLSDEPISVVFNHTSMSNIAGLLLPCLYIQNFFRKTVKFNLIFQDLEDHHLNEIAQCLISRTCRNLQALSIRIANSNITDEGMYDLSQALKTLTSLRTLRLDCSNNEQFTDNTFLHLSEAFQCLNELKQLDLNFEYCKKTGDGKIQGLNKILEGVRGSICDLILRLSDKKNYSDQVLNDLGSQLSQLKELKSCELKLSNLSMNTSQLKSILSGFAKTTKLEYLVLELNDINGATSDIFTSFSFFKHLTRLESLSLKMQNYQFSFSTISLLYNCENKLPQTLRDLNLDFEYCPNLSIQSLSYISKFIKSCKMLEKLTLKLNGAKNFSNIATNNELFEAIQGLKNLESLGLKFSDCGAFNNMKGFKQALQNKNELQSLRLSFANCKELDDNEIQMLSQSMKDLKIQDLYLDFADCGLISDLGVSYISEGIKSLNELKRGEIGFNFNQNISDAPLLDLLQEAKGMQNLDKLDIKTVLCPKISCQGDIMKFNQKLK